MSTCPASVLTPFLKWAGGKRWLVRKLQQHLPTEFGRYFEPFLGGGALFFSLRPTASILADTNQELINTYLQVRDNVEEVILSLTGLPISVDQYYQIRACVPSSPLQRAVRFLYLNKTAFNGLYRVNKKGEFNVPFGCKPGTVLCEADKLRQASVCLQHADIRVSDFEQTVTSAQAGDVVYFDPPYTVKHDNNGFRRYNESIFSWDDQERLAECARRLVDRGVFVLVSNACHRDIETLYSFLRPTVVGRRSLISGNRKGRTPVQEYLYYWSGE